MKTLNFQPAEGMLEDALTDISLILDDYADSGITTKATEAGVVEISIESEDEAVIAGIEAALRDAGYEILTQ